MSTETSPRLPDHPGDLIRLAVLDLCDVARLPKKYDIDMGVWHIGMSDGRCAVCFAGAVMARELNAQPTSALWPDSFSDADAEGKLRALDSFRRGWIVDGYDALRRRMPQSLPSSIQVTHYSNGPDKFLADMLDLAQMIDEAEGV